MAKSGIIGDPKIIELAVELDIMDCYAVGLMECFWQYVAKYHPSGEVSAAPAIVARSIRYTGDPSVLWAALVKCRLLDEVDGRFVVHKWPVHCDDATHMKLARLTGYFCDGSRPRFTRIGGTERAEIEAAYAQREALSPTQNTQDPQPVCNPCAREPHVKHTALPSPPLPSQAMPSIHLPTSTTPARAPAPGPGPAAVNPADGEILLPLAETGDPDSDGEPSLIQVQMPSKLGDLARKINPLAAFDRDAVPKPNEAELAELERKREALRRQREAVPA